ncbi:hypothetical protein Ciccas_008281 [Cichlidogyrus casuarinus]|uniref:inositol-phosphate phosphatase n=1 Tax=Cichlidogyrus casuarinus TaxID=1844966 RepID=A0ABD2Q0E1_9PLAT
MAQLRINAYGIFILSISLLTFILFWITSRRSVLDIDAPVISVRRLLSTCILLSEEAGDKIREIYQRKMLQTSQKLSNEPITQADIESNKIIMSRLFKGVPGIILRSEEELDIDDWKSIPTLRGEHPEVKEIIHNRDLFARLTELTVWVDPLDATQEFTEGITDPVAVLICIALGDNPIAGVVHQPFTNQTYWSWKFFGDSKTVSKLRPKEAKVLKSGDKIRVVVSRSHISASSKNSLKALLRPFDAEITSYGGSAFKVLEMLSGKADLYIHPTASRKWDLCAPNAILNSLGGIMVHMKPSTKPISYSSNSENLIQASSGFWATPHMSIYNELKDRMEHIFASLP